MIAIRWDSRDVADRETCARTLESGAVVLLPTESSYALAASAGREDAIDRVRRLKGRAEGGKPLLLLCATLDMAARAAELTAVDLRVAAAAWPGPLTLLAAARDPRLLRRLGGAALAVRVPACEPTRDVIARAGEPVTGTSANRAGRPPLLVPDALAAGLEVGDGGVRGALDAGALPGGPPSTIVDLRGDEPAWIREGAIPFDRLREILGLARE